MKIQFKVFLASVLSFQMDVSTVSAQPAHAKAKGHFKKFQLPTSEGDADIELYEGGPSIKCTMKKGKGKGNPRSCQSGSTSVTIVDVDCTPNIFTKNKNRNKKCFSASITEGETGKIYRVNRDGEIIERDSADYPPEEHPPNEDAPPEDQSDHRSLRGDAITMVANHVERSLQATPVIDILVVYTQGAKTDAEFHHDGPIEDLVNLAIAETNQAYINSGINAELNLRALHEDMSGYTADVGSSSMAPSLYHLTGIKGQLQDPDGQLDYIHRMRYDVGADMVALITTGAGCGIAWASGNCEMCNPTARLQFSVTHFSCATGNYSFGHELGHNMGALHDRGTHQTCQGYNGTPNPDTDSRYGYRDTNGQYRSILAYYCARGECDNNPGGRCTRSPFFSNPDPDYLWNGQPMGNPAGTEGIGETNNAKMINDRAQHIADFFDTVPPPANVPTGAPTVDCTDDATWHIVISGKSKYCGWIGRTESTTANRCANRVSTEGVPAHEACPEQCNPVCLPSKSPTAGPNPTNVAPTPPTVPTGAPTVDCTDDATWHTVISGKSRYCGWIGRTESTTANRCANRVGTEGVPAHEACPEQCNPDCTNAAA